MAITKKQYDDMESRLQSRIGDLTMMLVRNPDDTRRSGKLEGTESRYTLRVYYWQSGFNSAILVHHHPGQPDHVIHHGELSGIVEAYKYAGNEETRWIRDAAQAALFAHRKAEAA